MTPKHFHVAFLFCSELRSSGPPAVSVTSSISQPGDLIPAFPIDRLFIIPSVSTHGPSFHLLIYQAMVFGPSHL